MTVRRVKNLTQLYSFIAVRNTSSRPALVILGRGWTKRQLGEGRLCALDTGESKHRDSHLAQFSQFGNLAYL